MKTFPFGDDLPNDSLIPPYSLVVGVCIQTQFFHDVSIGKAFDATSVVHNEPTVC